MRDQTERPAVARAKDLLGVSPLEDELIGRRDRPRSSLGQFLLASSPRDGLDPPSRPHRLALLCACSSSRSRAPRSLWARSAPPRAGTARHLVYRAVHRVVFASKIHRPSPDAHSAAHPRRFARATTVPCAACSTRLGREHRRQHPSEQEARTRSGRTPSPRARASFGLGPRPPPAPPLSTSTDMRRSANAAV